jgi:hypothetical protein
MWRMGLVGALVLMGCGDGPVAVEQARPVARVEVSPGTHVLRAGEVYHADGSLLSEPVEWQSSDAQVAEVDGGGVVTARSGGSVMISARSGGRSGSTSLTVEVPPAPVAQVSIYPASPLSVGIGGTLQLAATASAADGTVLTGRAVEWTSSDSLVARISPAGVVEGRAEGTAVVSARVEGKVAYASVAVVFSRSPSEPVALVHVEAPRAASSRARRCSSRQPCAPRTGERWSARWSGAAITPPSARWTRPGG